MVYWDDDEYKDLLVGQADGTIAIFINANESNEDPIFEPARLVQVGPPGEKEDIDVEFRAASKVVDWNSDDRIDLVVGALDGMMHVFIDEGTGSEPDFYEEYLAQYDDGGTLEVPTARSSPAMDDLDDDDKKDLLSGNTEGQVVFYTNTGEDDDPVFSSYYLYVRSERSPIDLPPDPPEEGPRTRPSLCNWTGDGLPDVLLGAQDGKVHLYQDPFGPGDLNCDGTISFLDISPFVLALDNQEQYEAAFPHCDWLNADCNGDGSVSFLDISPFIELVSGS